MKKIAALFIIAFSFSTAIIAQNLPKWASKVSKGIVSVRYIQVLVSSLTPRARPLLIIPYLPAPPRQWW